MIPNEHTTARREDNDLPVAPRFDPASANAPESARVCRRCLLENMADERAAYLLVGEWLSALPPDRRAEEAVYRARLGICSSCDHLNSGTCALCGCYVELRAGIAAAACPSTPPNWTPCNDISTPS